MGVNVAIGDPAEFFGPPGGTLIGGTTGFNIQPNLAGWTAFLSLLFAIQTTATVGNRTWRTDILGADGTVWLREFIPFNMPASTTVRGMAGAGIPFYQGANNFVISVPFPKPAFIPPGGSLRVADSAAVDPNDSLVNTPVLILTT